MSNLFDITQFIDKEKGKVGYVCGMGPSLRDHIDFIKKTEGILITCSDVDIMTDLIPDYWVFANSINNAPYMNNRWRLFENTTIVHADSVDTTPSSWIKENITNKYIGYDQRHFNNKTCKYCPNNCANFVEGRKTIQELLMEYTKHKSRYNTGHTVALHCLALAILLGCSKIYIFGVDLDYSLGYVDKKTSNHESFSPWLPEILEDFETIKESSRNIGVEIYNTSEISPLINVFETIKLIE